MRTTSGPWRALALAAGLWMAFASPAPALGAGDDAAPSPKPAPKTETPPAESTAVEPAARSKGRKVELKLVIAGLGAEGCEVEVKPGNPAIEFEPQTFRVPSNGRAAVTLKDVELLGVDRNCTFAVVVREKDQAPKTIYRGFRLPTGPASKRSGDLSFTCFLSSASRIAELQSDDRARR